MLKYCASCQELTRYIVDGDVRVDGQDQEETPIVNCVSTLDEAVAAAREYLADKPCTISENGEGDVFLDCISATVYSVSCPDPGDDDPDQYFNDTERVVDNVDDRTAEAWRIAVESRRDAHSSMGCAKSLEQCFWEADLKLEREAAANQPAGE